MKRSNDKIKDFVEARPYEQVSNYSIDLTRALAAYKFTDATSLLVSQWLDTLANLPRNAGAARAIAGVRGVGKSHTLAAFSALVLFPDLRTAISDSHVAVSARRLLEQRFQLVRVERGSRPTLLEEVKAGFAASIGGSESDWSDNPAAMLAVAASRVGDLPLFIVIDTAFGRESHVRRDDGPFLTDLARATHDIKAFIALALDDDIEGADGANVGLSGVFHIDYLDPEHLYRVADTHLFHKTPHALAALHELYDSLRSSVPGFDWSEPRFTSIYPVHPLIADISAAVRLFSPDFAFLPFAASAVSKSINRPARSLIALDEVFDSCEADFRKADELHDAFEAFDSLSADSISALPVMERMQAKLILKSVFVQSLDGRGATPAEVNAAMLFFDSETTEEGIERISRTLLSFAQSAPNGTFESIEEGTTHRYRFKISASASFETTLSETASASPPSQAELADLLRGIARARFSDWPFSGDQGRTVEHATVGVSWRGTSRFGRLLWLTDETDSTAFNPAEDNIESIDWDVVTLAPKVGEQSGMSPALGIHNYVAVWKPAGISESELQALRRLYVLRTDASLFENFGETARASERTHTALAERCFTRIYIDDADFSIGDVQRRFNVEARSARSLSEMLGVVLAPMLGVRFSQHPVFAENLGETEVATLVGGLFGGASPNDVHVQALARHFAAPLGLATIRGGNFVLGAGDQVLRQPWVRQILAMTDAAGGAPVACTEIFSKLRAEPYGLQREAQQLILAALVAQRRVELITQSGDRITRRTLDQRLKWNEITGVARAAVLLHNSEELSSWAATLTANETLGVISDPIARDRVRSALAEWLGNWKSQNILEKLSKLPDQGLTTRVWNLSAAVRKGFGSAAEAIDDALSDDISLEEGLQRVADAFRDSKTNFEVVSNVLAQLTELCGVLATREEQRTYLLLTEPALVEELESARRELMKISSDVHNLLDADMNRRFDLLWRAFRLRYMEHYAEAHDAVVGHGSNRDSLKTVLKSDEWREFQTLSTLPFVDRGFYLHAEQLIDRARSADCTLPVRRYITSRPYCACMFRLTKAAKLRRLPQELMELVEAGLRSHKRTLVLWARNLALALNVSADQQEDGTDAEKFRSLAARMTDYDGTETITVADADLINETLTAGGVPPLHVSFPRDSSGLLTREDLKARLDQWLNGLPEYPAMLDVAFGEARNDGT